MNINIKPIEDIKKELISTPKKNIFFREYFKIEDKFIASNKFFISDEVGDNKIGFISYDFNTQLLNNEKIIPYLDNDIYINKINESKDLNYIDLILIDNISFDINDININKFDIINKFINNDLLINEKLLEDIYYNTNFSNKINIELPKMYNNKKIILKEIEIIKKYLFKINFIELNKNFNFENFYLIQ